ncbi:MAG: enoyl-CoA hydratase/isomerase family protein [Rhodoferax sp.]|nr:enoyl-CoA hydratase/isomerase family protein [Rhodoferax sp.]
MSLRMVQELQTVLQQAEQGGAVRVLVLRGAGGHFCAGGDLKDMAAARDARHAGARGVGAGRANADPVAEVNAASVSCGGLRQHAVGPVAVTEAP